MSTCFKPKNPAKQRRKGTFWPFRPPGSRDRVPRGGRRSSHPSIVLRSCLCCAIIFLAGWAAGRVTSSPPPPASTTARLIGCSETERDFHGLLFCLARPTKRTYKRVCRVCPTKNDAVPRQGSSCQETQRPGRAREPQQHSHLVVGSIEARPHELTTHMHTQLFASASRHYTTQSRFCYKSQWNCGLKLSYKHTSNRAKRKTAAGTHASSRLVSLKNGRR